MGVFGFCLQRGTPGYMAPEVSGFQDEDEENSSSTGKSTAMQLRIFKRALSL